MDIMEYIADKTANHQDASLDDIKVKAILTGKSYVKDGQPGNESFITAKGEYEIPYSELYTASNPQSTATLPARTYTTGEEVEFGNEKFFVLTDEGTTVKLLTKYCLNRTGTMQMDKNAQGSDYGRALSKTNYWSNDYTDSPIDLQNETMITKAQADGNIEEGIPNALVAAKKYGESKGVNGRLMSFDEAIGIINGTDEKMKRLLFGKWTSEDATDVPICGFNFWIGRATTASVVLFIYGDSQSIYGQNYNVHDVGVRPVLIVPEG